MDEDETALLPEIIFTDIYLTLARVQGAEHAVGAPFSWTASVYPVWGRACFEEGADLAALTATELGRPVYEAMGFRKVSTLGRWSASVT